MSLVQVFVSQFYLIKNEIKIRINAFSNINNMKYNLFINNNLYLYLFFNLNLE